MNTDDAGNEAVHPLVIRLPEDDNTELSFNDDESPTASFTHTFRRLLLWGAASALAAGSSRKHGSSTNMLLLGLKGAGATSLVYRLKLHDFIAPVPTMASLHESFKLRHTCLRHKWTHGGLPPLKAPSPVVRDYCQLVEHKINTIDVGRLSRFAKRFSGVALGNNDAPDDTSPCLTEYLAPAIRKYLMITNCILILLDGTKLNDSAPINFWRTQLSWLLYDIWVERRKAKFAIVVTKIDLQAWDIESLVQQLDLPVEHRGSRWQIFHVSSKTGTGISQLATWLLFPPELVATAEEEAYEQRISLMEKDEALDELRRLSDSAKSCRFVLIPNGHEFNRFNFEHREALRLGHDRPKSPATWSISRNNSIMRKSTKASYVISPALLGRRYENLN